MDSSIIEIATRKDKNLVLDVLGCGCLNMGNNEVYSKTLKDRFILFCVTSENVLFEGN